MLKKDSLKEMMKIEDNKELKDQHQVMECKLEDRIFFKFQVEKENYNHAINIHKLKDDWKVQEKLREIEDMVTPEFQERMHLILQSDYSEEHREAIDDMMQEVNEYTNDDDSEPVYQRD